MERENNSPNGIIECFGQSYAYLRNATIVIVPADDIGLDLVLLSSCFCEILLLLRGIRISPSK